MHFVCIAPRYIKNVHRWLSKPFSRVGAALVGVGALTAEELKADLAEHVRRVKLVRSRSV
jgi:hypothetical protein